MCTVCGRVELGAYTVHTDLLCGPPRHVVVLLVLVVVLVVVVLHPPGVWW